MRRVVLALLLAAMLLAALLAAASTAEAEQGWTAVVTTSTLNIRAAPTTASSIVGVLHYGDVITITATVRGEPVKGDDLWYQIGPGQYVYGAYVGAIDGTSAGYGSGYRWIDIDLTNKIARAMVGNTPVYSAEVTIGRPGWNTPVGTFSIVRRVGNETMDSETIGIPRDSPDGYYYTGVLYTQYFLWTGQALHYNYWVPDEAFGNWASSRGCIGLRLADAKFFWDFADIGTEVVIHY